MRLIERDAELKTIIDELKESKICYLDTEFESNAKYKKLCILQIGTEKGNHLLDMTRLSANAEFAEALFRSDLLWVLHAGMQDVALLAEFYERPFPEQLFDTQVAWALCSPENSVSLAYLKFKLLNVRTSKGHQSDAWMRRPLSASQLEYALSDIVELPMMYQLLRERLEKLDRYEICLEASAETIRGRKKRNEFLQLTSFRNLWQLNADSQSVMIALVDWYNREGSETAESILPAKSLLAVAARIPQNENELLRLKGIPRGAQRRSAELLKIISLAVRSANSENFEELSPPPYATVGGDLRHGWLSYARAQLAASLNVSAEFILPSRIIGELSFAWEQQGRAELGAALDGWRETLIRDGLMRLLHEAGPSDLAEQP